MPVRLQSAETVHAAPRAFQGLSGYSGREFLAALRELRREPRGRVPTPRRRGALHVHRPALAEGRHGDVPARSRQKQWEAGRPRGVGEEQPGLELRWSQEQEKERGVFQTPNLGAARTARSLPLIRGLQGIQPKDGSADLLPPPFISPPPGQGGRQLHSRFWKGEEVSDCTPPTGVRWAAQDRLLFSCS